MSETVSKTQMNVMTSDRAPDVLEMQFKDCDSSQYVPDNVLQ